MAHHRRKRPNRRIGLPWKGRKSRKDRFKGSEIARRRAADAELRELEADFAAINRRRHQLLSQEVSSGLTRDEAEELARVEEWVDAVIDRLHPVPLEYLKGIVKRAGIVIEEE